MNELAALLRERLVPQPQSMSLTGGELPWNSVPFALQLQGSFTADAHLQLTSLLKNFEYPLSHEFVGAPESRSVAGKSQREITREVPLRVNCLGMREQPDSTSSEAYELAITSDGISLRAPTQAGILRGGQTLAQILSQSRELGLVNLPCLTISDEPQLSWRGILIDVARHFVELPALLKTLEGMAHHKLNVLHLHLTDDQAFRFPSAAYPKLNEAGPFYSHHELRVLVAYAESLGIRVVPELDMPGHTTCWLAAYPEWSLYEVEPTTRFGVHPGCLNPASETTYDVISVLLSEFAEIFTDEYVHVGGDEVHPRWWREHPEVQRFMAEHSLAAPRDLQAYFNTRVSAILKDQNKQMLVWDDAVHESLPEDTLVQAWRGMTARDAAVARGHKCIVSSPYYLDLFYSTDTHTQFAPLLPLDEAVRLEDAMLTDERLSHVAGGLEWTRQWRDRAEDLAANKSPLPRLEKNVIGAEACLWSELVDEDLLDVRLWSRMPLLAELFWRGAVDDVRYTRTAHALRSWHALGGPRFGCVTGDPLSRDQLDLLAPLGITSDVADLLAVLEPSKWYSRLLGAKALAARLEGSEMPQARPYGTKTPLRTVACVISPQSMVCAEFAELLERWGAAPLGKNDRNQLRDWIVNWGSQAGALRALALKGETAETLRELADRLQKFSAVLAFLFEDWTDLAFDGEAALNLLTQKSELPKQLQAMAAPVGELMLAPTLTLLIAINRRLPPPAD